MPLTKTKAIVAFKHVLNTVFEIPDDGPLEKALEQAGYDNIWTLITSQDADIEALTFDRSATEKDIPLGRAHQSLLCIFRHYCDHQTHNGTPIEHDSWTAVTADEFNDYHTGLDYSVIQCTGAPLLNQDLTNQ